MVAELVVSAQAERRAPLHGVSVGVLLLTVSCSDRRREKAGVVIRAGTWREVRRMDRQGACASAADMAFGAVRGVAGGSRPQLVTIARAKLHWAPVGRRAS